MSDPAAGGIVRGAGPVGGGRAGSGEAGRGGAVARLPIGVFDSGVGGLTVLRALRAAMPAEDFIYLGDTARLPYGTKSADTVVRYSLQCADALLSRGVRCLVVACNTASASALDALRARHPTLPIIGVIQPGAEAAVAASESQHIAVIATEGTVNGGAYRVAIHRLNGSARVVSQACALFVAMAEEGWTQGPIVEAVAHRYLDPIFSARGAPDTLVLGCTHFPVLAAAIRAVLPPQVRVVDSAATTAAAVLRQLHGPAASGAAAAPASAMILPYATQPSRPAVPPGAIHGIPALGSPARGRVTWLATDGAERFARVGSAFLGETLTAAAIEIVDL